MASKITVALDWTPNGNHLGFFVAKDKGLYDAAGLDVTIVSPADAEYDGSYNPGDEDADAPGAPKYVTPCSKVAEGSAHFAMNSPEGVVGWNTAPGRPQLKAVAALLRDRNSSAIVALKSSGITSPKDLDGKRYASYAARFEGRIVQRMIQHAGGAGDYIEDTPPMLGIWNSLVEGKFDATWVFMQWEGVEAQLKGVELNAFPVCDYGVPYAYAPCLIIFSGIVAEIPRALASTFELGRTGAISSVAILSILVLLLVAIYFIVYVERAQRRILIQYPKRQMGNKMYGGESSYLPLKVNTAGVIPAIFASALLLLPVTLSNFSTSSNSMILSITSMLGQGKPLYMIFYASGIVFFSFFYTSIIFNPVETSDNLKKNGGFVPGIRPGDKTSEFIQNLLTKLTVIGSSYLVIICLLPEVLISKYPIPFYLGGTSLLIVAVVAMDTITQVQTRLMSAQYASLIKKTKFSR